MPSYNLLQEYTDVKEPDAISKSGWVVLAVIGLAKPFSYSRQDGKSVTSTIEGGKSRGGIIIANDCTQLQISNSKESHTKNLRATLKQNNINYLSHVFPGDWIAAWMVNSKDKFLDIIKRINNGEAVNNFDDGLKFLGRVNSIRKNLSLSSEGFKSVSFSIDAFAFRELDSMIYYDNALAEKILQDQKINNVWLAKIGLDIAKLFAFEETTPGVAKNNARLVISSLIKTIVGSGIKSENINVGPSQLSSAVGSIASAEAPAAYLVPDEVGKLIGKTAQDGNVSKSSGVLAYSDLIELYTGVQKYENGTGGTTPSDPKTVFYPKVKTMDGIERFSGDENLGSYHVIYGNFVNRPLWSILEQFRNPVINELFTCLRVNPDGKIVPQVIFRQIPFTTPIFANMNNQRFTQESIESTKQSNNQGVVPFIGANSSTEAAKSQNDIISNTATQIPVTAFHALPRWVIPKIAIKSVSLGRSDTTRTNFVHVYGQDPMVSRGGAASLQYQMVKNPPRRDDLDIQRSGLRPFMATVASNQLDQVGSTPGAWIDLVTDYLMGSQYTLNGNLECIGIQSPICEGDNVQFDNTVYHIESVNHNFNLASDGTRSFTTSLSITNGLRATNYSEDTGDTDVDNSIYPGVKSTDVDDFEPGFTTESFLTDTDIEELA